MPARQMPVPRRGPAGQEDSSRLYLILAGSFGALSQGDLVLRDPFPGAALPFTSAGPRPALVFLP